MSIVPTMRYSVPTLNHDKLVPYIDYPVVYEDTKTNEPFYVDHPFTFATSDDVNTTLYKWNGVGWTEVAGINNPEYIFGIGFYSVTTAANATAVVTEHVHGEVVEQ